MSVPRWELWSSDESQTFFPEDNEQARRMAIKAGETLEWETTARGWNSAHQAMYDYRGWDTYRPNLRDNGTPYPEDEDHDYPTTD
jgi:hypothetical protein